LVGEYFARLDRADVEGVLELYADDAVLQDAKGKDAIRQAILSSSAAVAGQKSPHIPTNIRAASTDDGVAVDYTVVAYLQEGPGPYPAVAILNQRQILKRSASDGSLQIAEHRVQGFDLEGPGVTVVDKPVRRDVARNRVLLMQSAEELFAKRGTEVTLEEIARHAGVGVATAYRHFASKSAIVEAMLENRIGKFLAVLAECESIADPREAFETYLYRICELQATDRGMREAISANHGINKVAEFRDRGKASFERLFSRAKQAGAFRPECELSDIVVAFWMIGKVSDSTDRSSPDQWRRQLGFLLDGLRAGAMPRQTPVTPALSMEQIESIMATI
jgi:AcrR family transcriptional regulator